jgi:hypothetical protein
VPPSQATPQAPQFTLSESMKVQPLRQSVCAGDGQTHAPSRHERPTAHQWPGAPQFSRSRFWPASGAGGGPASGTGEPEPAAPDEVAIAGSVWCETLPQPSGSAPSDATNKTTLATIDPVFTAPHDSALKSLRLFNLICVTPAFARGAALMIVSMVGRTQ